jgi:serine/threonine protein kinase
MDLSDSGFIAPHTISTNWSDIALFQQRNHNMLYHAKRYGKYFVLKGLSADCQLLTDHLFLQEKEFAFGVSLTHPHIAETYSLEEVEGCGRCIVMEYVDGTTLAEWLSTNPSKAARQRVMMQLLDALEYIHSLQLVHHDLKSSNILITRNGQNVKLIDFGLSNTDSTSANNNSTTDIQLLANILTLLFPNRYRPIVRACQQGKYANIAALKQAFHRRQIWQKSIPYIVSAICVIVCSIFSFQYISNKLREQQMLKTVNYHVNQEISKLQNAADTCTTYLALAQQHYPMLWEKSALVRDSIADLYADDPALRLQCIEIWSLIFGERFMQFDNRIKQDKLISTN